MLYLKQSTSVNVQIGVFVDDTDGSTLESGLTIAQADVRLSKNGGNFAAKNDATSCTYDEVGFYSCPLDATDTGTLGRLQLVVVESGALPVFHEYMVVTANVYDTLCSTDQLDVNVTNIEGADPTDQINAACDTALTDYDAATGTELAAVDTKIDTIDGIVDDILVDTGTTLQAELDGIQADTEDLQTQIGTAGAGLTAVPWNASWDAEVQSECADALTAYDPPTRTELTSDKDEIITEIDANETKIDTIDTNVDSILTDTGTTLPAAIAALNDLDADGVWDEVVEGSLTARQIVRIVLAALAGKSTGGGTTSIKFRDQGDTKDRITATVDEDNNRDAVSVDGS